MAMEFNLHDYLQRQAGLINSEIKRIFNEQQSRSHIVDAMFYSVSAGGKRIRPILCLAAAEAVGGDTDKVVPAACAIELIHTYSLIHDDLPAMDNDELRRGVPTSHMKYDEATAILAGDGLLTLAFKIMSGVELNGDAGRYLSVIGILADAAGHKGMIEGQMRDMDAEGKALTIEELEAMHQLKTGAMIEAAVHIGALLGGGDGEQIDSLRRYGAKIGLAFQVTDDLLNIGGDPQIMGKAVGTDREKMKNTYPALLGSHKSEAYAEKLIDEALQAIAAFDHKAAPLGAIAKYIIHRNK